MDSFFRYKHQYCTEAAYLDERSAFEFIFREKSCRVKELDATGDMHKYSIKIQYGADLEEASRAGKRRVVFERRRGGVKMQMKS